MVVSSRSGTGRTTLKLNLLNQLPICSLLSPLERRQGRRSIYISMLMSCVPPESTCTCACPPGLMQSGALEFVSNFFKKTYKYVSGHGVRPLIYHTMVPISLISFFINNTPIVALMIPVIADYARVTGVGPSKLMIPLAYACMVGGTGTLIGTSTNLVALDLAAKKTPDIKFSLFTQTPVGLPVMLTGILYMAVMTPWLLPNRLGVSESVQNPREYMMEMIVDKDAPFIGKTVEQAGLRMLDGLFLVRVERESGSTPAPGPEFVLQPADKLYFAGDVDSVLQLAKVRGLKLVEEQAEAVDLHRLTNTEEMVEVVLSSSSPLNHKTVRESQFRTTYGAAIVAVHRAGERIHGLIGDIKLQTGDTLLLVAKRHFVKTYSKDSTFALVSKVHHFKPVQRRMAPLAILLIICMIIFPIVFDEDSSNHPVKLLQTTMLVVGAFLLLKVLTPQEAREALNMEILITIAASYGVSAGLVEAGGAKILADWLVKASHPFGKPGFYFFTYVGTAMFSQVVTNNAAVSMMYPIAYLAAKEEGYDQKDMLLLLMFGASAAFTTPNAYQCNLMVWGPGGYHYSDYVKYGGLLNILMAFTTTMYILLRDYWYAFTVGLFLFNLALFLFSLRGKKQEITTMGSTLTTMPLDIESRKDKDGEDNII
eukprot:jgi/Mesvir1/5680/Mv15696-RA.1